MEEWLIFFLKKHNDEMKALALQTLNVLLNYSNQNRLILS